MPCDASHWLFLACYAEGHEDSDGIDFYSFLLQCVEAFGCGYTGPQVSMR